ncbi:hypothetical protein CDD80_1845 [Ophiocordyceps camponoti-rufipedis]|uniref:F-box domain-containing protein n=1 Tax=Ophiocordyceps camponoti-rufipedis TaxID=2004952 RepID=A0A2C5Z9J2_9HYPO|nr:hypothetical protein CDD80_1845 [Ophiocordyceps camponoti-rufipedis]
MSAKTKLSMAGDPSNMGEAAPLFAKLPNESIHNIFSLLDPVDLVSLARVCRLFCSHIKGNRALFHSVYKRLLDTPPKDVEIDYEAEVRRLARLQVICSRPSVDDNKHELEFVSKAVDRLLELACSNGHTVDNSQTYALAPSTHATSYNVQLLARLFSDPSTRSAFMQRSSLFQLLRCGTDRVLAPPGPPQKEHQLSAKLHCLLGRPLFFTNNECRRPCCHSYSVAAPLMYAIRADTRLAHPAPFLDDGSGGVDWEKVEAVIIVLGTTMWESRVAELFPEIWNSPFSGSFAQSFVPPPEPDMMLSASDPYNVTGTWYRVLNTVGLAEEGDLNLTSTQAVRDYLQNTIVLQQLLRLHVMRIDITSFEKPGPMDGQNLPVVHFKGVSWPLEGDDYMPCSVRLTRHGDVRWLIDHVRQGDFHLGCDGVQLGGVRSARGVVGHWFAFDPHGPWDQGPMAFWKMTDSNVATDEMHDAFVTQFGEKYQAVLESA